MNQTKLDIISLRAKMHADKAEKKFVESFFSERLKTVPDPQRTQPQEMTEE